MHYYFDPDRANYIDLGKGATAAYRLHYHFVFPTKFHHKTLDRNIAQDLVNLLVAICKERDYRLLGLQVQPDHLHILISLKPKEKLSFVVQMLKGRTSRELRKKYSQLSKLPALWTPAYFVRSLGEVNTAQIKAYLDRQDEHHWVMRGSTKVR